MLQKRDLLWILAYPIYQIIGTIRHEGSHALVALLEGARVTEFVFWPSITKYGFYWGYVRITGSTDWVFLAAPYLVDLLTFTVFFCVCMWLLIRRKWIWLMWLLIRRKWIWLNLVIIGLISPLANSLYNYLGSPEPNTDVGKLLDVLPGVVVHGYFWLTLSLYILGIFLVFKFSRTARFMKTQKGETQN
ncbi:MAG: hypothetical protein JRF62_17295 [Deltaproteobacteria bacterium]|nr:hypothetical protein [Deltaproteobacteria bacterium]